MRFWPLKALGVRLSQRFHLHFGDIWLAFVSEVPRHLRAIALACIWMHLFCIRVHLKVFECVCMHLHAFACVGYIASIWCIERTWTHLLCICPQLKAGECIWLHLRAFGTLSSLARIWMHSNAFKRIWLYLNAFVHIWMHLNEFEIN